MSAIHRAMQSAEEFAEALNPQAYLKDEGRKALQVLRPALAMVPSVVKRLNWRLVMLGVVAGAAGLLIRSMMRTNKTKALARQRPKPPEINRWENEGGAVSGSGLPRPTGLQVEAGMGAGYPPLN